VFKGKNPKVRKNATCGGNKVAGIAKIRRKVVFSFLSNDKEKKKRLLRCWESNELEMTVENYRWLSGRSEQPEKKKTLSGGQSQD